MSKTTITVKINGDPSGLKSSFGEAEVAATGFVGTMEGVGNKLQNIGGGMESVGRKATMGVTLPILGIGTASFLSAANMQDAMGATDQIFGGASDDVKNWADNLQSYYGIAESEALEYINMMGSMLQNIGGLTEEEAARQGATLLELAGDMTAMFGGTTEDAVNALTGALKGNNTMLDNYGMTATDAQIKQRALEMGIWDGVGAMSAEAKQAATLNLIMEQSAAAQGQAARESEGASGQMRAFTTDMKNLGAELGAHILPLGTQLIAKVRGIFEWFQKLSPESQRQIVMVAGIAAAMGPLLIVTGKLITALGAIAKAMAFLAANPIVLVIAAVVALVAGLVYAYHNFETFREVVDKVFAFIAERAQQLWNNGLKPAFEAISRFIVGTLVPAIGVLWQHFQVGWDIISAAAIDAWQNVINPTFRAIGEFITVTLIPTLQELWSQAQVVFAAIGEVVAFAWSNVLSPIFTAIVWYIQNVVIRQFQILWTVVSTVFSGVVSAIRTAWPAISSVFETIKGGISAVSGWISGRVGDIVGFFTGLPGRIAGAAGNMFGWIGDSMRAALQRVANIWNNFRFPSFDIPRVSFMGVTVGGGSIGGWSLPRVTVPAFAHGGIALARPGGMLANIAEAGRDEAVIPLPSDWRTNGLGGGDSGDTYYLTVNAGLGTNPDELARRIEELLVRLSRKKGKLMFKAAS